jgi:hypothetical protein
MGGGICSELSDSSCVNFPPFPLFSAPHLTANSQSIGMFLARIFFIRLQESAKFLVAANRPSAAVIALRKISKMNGEEVRWSLSDVVDEASSGAATETGGKEGRGAGGDYDATGSSPSRATSPLPDVQPTLSRTISSFTLDDNESTSNLDLEGDAEIPPAPSTPSPLRSRQKSRSSWIGRFPTSWQPAVEDYAARFGELLEPEYKRTTLLVFALWTLASAGYTVRLLPPSLFFSSRENLS